MEDNEDAGLFRKADNCLKKIVRYIDANYLHINLDKTKYMKFTSPHGKNISTNGISYHLKYENIIIKRVSNIKFLGVILNEKIDWSPQISKATRKISSINGILYNLRKFIPENLDLKKSIYFALVNSHLIYGISVWGCAGDKSKLQKLFVAQKNCIRNLLGIPKLNRYTKGHTIHNLYFYNTLTEVYKVWGSGTPIDLRAILTVSNINENRLLTPINNKLAHLSKNFYYATPLIWNTVHSYTDFNFDGCKFTTSTQKFKNYLNKYLLTKQSLGFENYWEDRNICL